MPAKSATERLDEAYAAFVEGHHTEPSVRQLREMAGVAQTTTVTYLRKRRQATLTSTTPDVPEELIEMVRASLWPQAWTRAHEAAAQSVRDLLEEAIAARGQAEDRAHKAEAAATSAAASAKKAAAAQRAAEKSRLLAEGKTSALTEQIAKLQAENEGLREDLDAARRQAATIEGVVAGLREALHAQQPADQ